MSKLILVGSNHFFQKIKGFHSKDKDYVMLVDKPDGFKFVRQTSSSFCLFEWKKMSAQEFVDYSLENGVPMQIGKFLIPTFCSEIDFTIEHLKQLKPLIEKLDAKHNYEKIIYDAYILNGSYTLTEEQLNTAYESYVETRKVGEE